MLMLVRLCRNEGEWGPGMWRLCWRVAERRFGVQLGMFTQRGAYEFWELFRVANGRPDSARLDGSCF